MKVAVLEESFVETAVWILILPITMLFAIDNISDVSATVSVCFLSYTVGPVVRPVSHIAVSLEVIRKPPLAMCNIISNLAFIDRAIAVNISSISIGDAIREGSDEMTAIGEV